MQDLPNTTPAPLTFDTTGSDFKFETYDIAPEDQELAASIANFDIIADVPSPIEMVGEFKEPKRFSADMLPDGPRDWVKQQLVSIPAGEARDKREHELTLMVLRDNSKFVRMRLGAGNGANAYQREVLSIGGELDQLNSEFQRIQNSLNEVLRLEVTGIDPVTGEQPTKTIYRYEGDARQKMGFRLAEITRHIAALEGPEGDRRKQKALLSAVEAHKTQQATLNRAAKAKARADEILEEEEVERLAQAFAKNRRHTLG
jgi:hypothetical protein